MSVMDGYTLVQQLRDAGNIPPVLMITAKDAFNDILMTTMIPSPMVFGYGENARTIKYKVSLRPKPAVSPIL
jgi:CheY-like chemotaxis protein